MLDAKQIRAKSKEERGARGRKWEVGSKVKNKRSGKSEHTKGVGPVMLDAKSAVIS